MKVLQFAFGSGNTNEHLPEAYTENSVVYTGTHDCNTTQGYFNSLPNNYEKRFVEHYLHVFNFKNIHWDIIAIALASKAKIAIIPFQDILGLGSESRFNLPGTVSTKNWTWRTTKQDYKTDLFENLKKLTTAGIRHGYN